MTELKGIYATEQEDQADYVAEAMELLHGEPSVEIEVPRKVTERHGGKLIEVERSAFVKLYTSFKVELKEMEGVDLKIWIYLVLSINRFTKDARPGLRKIASDLGIAVNTVQAGIERLENKGLLDVKKSEGMGNRYHPCDYASVSKTDTPIPVTVSKNGGTVSKNTGTVSVPRREIAQLEELESTRLDIRFAKIQTALEKIGVLLTASDPAKIDLWMEKHTDEHIQKAIDITQAKGIRNTGYINTILAGWLESGYPQDKKKSNRKKPDSIQEVSQAEIIHLQNSLDWSVT